jgi:hypothetical protein
MALDFSAAEDDRASEAGPDPTITSPASNMSAAEEDDELSPSVRLALELQQEEMGEMQRPDFSDPDLDDETRQTLELAWRLQEEERLRIQEQNDAAERLQGEPEDEESIALAIRLQQEDDESALRDALGVAEGEEPVSPSQYSYEQLMRLQETVGMVSKGASAEDIIALRTVTVQAARADSTIILGEQCSICRMEWEPEDELRVLRCCHAEHAECLDQWLEINKSCPLCQCEVTCQPADVSAELAPPAASAAPPNVLSSPNDNVPSASPVTTPSCPPATTITPGAPAPRVSSSA